MNFISDYFDIKALNNSMHFSNFEAANRTTQLKYAEMPNYIVYPEVEDNFVKSQNEEFQEDIFPTEQNPDQLGEDDKLLNSELDNEKENIGSEDDDNNYYSLRDNTHNDSKLLIALTIGTLISLGILVNSMLS